MMGRAQRDAAAEPYRVALTFDDGPDDVYTPAVLDILAARGVPAVFFCVGRQVERHPDVLRRIVEEGHAVANHTWSHPHLTRESPERVREEIERTRALIQDVAGVDPVWLRPPFGDWDAATAAAASGLGWDIVFWDVDSADWSGIAGPEVAGNVLSRVHGDAVVLHHSAGNVAGCPAALPYELTVGAARGWRFVGLSDLRDTGPYRAG